MLDEEVAMLEQRADLLLLPGDLAGLGLLRLAGSAVRLLGDLGPEFLADRRQGVQHRLGDLLFDVELTNLMWHIGPQLMERLGVQVRAVRRNSLDFQAAHPAEL